MFEDRAVVSSEFINPLNMVLLKPSVESILEIIV